MPVVNYIWDELDDNIQFEMDDGGNVIAQYEHEPGLYGEANSQTRDGVKSYFHYDGQGSTRALTDENQNVTDTFTYTAFGEIVDRTGVTETPYLFHGAYGYQTNNETSDLYIRRRKYLPLIGRWMSSDPLHYQDGPNTYTFAGNAPLSAIDPSGLLAIVAARGNELGVVGCGKRAEVSWNFFLETTVLEGGITIGAPCDGYIVQRVEVNCLVSTCEQSCDVDENGDPLFTFDNGPYVKSFHVSDTFVYYEAWRVGKTGRKSDEVREKGSEYTDRARWDVPELGRGATSRWGVYHQAGEVRFYCENDTGDLNAIGSGWHKPSRDGGRKHYGRVPCDTTAGVLLSFDGDAGPPGFWKAANVPIDGPAFRNFRVDFNCCREGEQPWQAWATATPSTFEWDPKKYPWYPEEEK